MSEFIFYGSIVLMIVGVLSAAAWFDAWFWRRRIRKREARKRIAIDVRRR